MSFTRPSLRPFAAAVAPRRRPPLHRIGLAAALVLSHAPGWTLPTGQSTVAGQVSVTNQGATQTIRQGSDKAIIDWQSFSIGAGERVNVLQPSAQATLLNRVIGYDPSRILGQLQSNGRVFLVNPYGIVFGAGARIDVGGLVASTLDLGNADFMAGRFSFTANAQSNASIVNEGSIVSRAGIVVLVAPQLTNSGSIEANGGRIGLAAANNALVDLDGDGLVFLNVNGEQAANRLNQLGRLQADAGTIELRAAARAAMADTVLNLEGVVQARSIGTRNGRIVIDGGDSGVSRVNGVVDATGGGANERGGEIAVSGRHLLLDSKAVLDASGDAGGGRVRAGGGWQGGDADVRNAERVIVRRDAAIRSDARNMGDGGTVVVWAEDSTVYRGSISAQGGSAAGDGGQVEVSGKKFLNFTGAVTTAAPRGRVGTVLLDPSNIEVKTGGSSPSTDVDEFGDKAGDSLDVSPTTLSNVVGLVTLQATNNVTFTDAFTLNVTKNTGLKVQAGNNINVNALITGSGLPVTLSAHDPGTTQVAGGAVSIKSGGGITNSGTGTITITNNASTGSNDVSGTLTAAAGLLTVSGNTVVASGVTVTGGTGGVSFIGAVKGEATNKSFNVDASGGTISFDTAITQVNTVTFGAGSTANLVGATANGSLVFSGNAGLTGTYSVAGGATAFSVAGTTKLSGNTIVNAVDKAVTFTGTVNGTAGTETLKVSTTGLTTFQAAVGGTTKLGGVTVDTGNVVAGAITTGGNIQFSKDASLSGNVATNNGGFTVGQATTLTGNVAVAAGSGNVAFTGTVDGANSLQVTSSGTIGFGGKVGNGTPLSSVTVDGTGGITLPELVKTSAGQSYAGPITLTQATTTLQGSTIGLSNTVDGDKALVLTNTGTATIGGAIGGGTALTSLSVSGATALNASVTTTTTQGYTGDVTVGDGKAVTLKATAVTLGGNLAVGNGSTSLSVLADTFTFDTATKSVTGTGALTLAPLTLANKIKVAGGTDGTYEVSQTLLDEFTTLSSVTIGQATGTGEVDVGAIGLTSNLVLQGGNQAVTLEGAVTGNGKALTITTTAATTLDKALSGLSDLTVTNSSTLSTNVTTSGAQSYGGTLTLGGNVTLSGSSVSIAALTGDTKDLTLRTDALSITGAVSGTGAASIAGSTDGKTIGLAGADKDLDLSQALLDKFATFTGLTIGSATQTGGITSNAIKLSNATTTVQGAGATVNFTGMIDGDGKALVVTNPGGTTTIGDVATALTSLSVSGATALNASVTTTTTQGYTGDVTVGDGKAVTLKATAVTLGGNLAVGNGSTSLSVLADTFTFDTATKSVTGTGALTLAPLTLANKIKVAGGTDGTYEVSQALLDEFTTLSSVTIGQATGTGEIDVGAIGLTSNLVLQGGNQAVTLEGAVTGSGKALTITTTAATTLDKALSGLSDLTVTNSSTLSTNVTTSGAQSYGGTLKLGANTSLSGGSVTVNNLDADSKNLTLKTDGLTIGGTVSNGAALSIAGSTDAKTIGLAGSDKDLDLSTTLLNTLGAFSSLTIGSATQTGDITSNAIVLPTATTIQGNTAAVNFTGTIDGNAKALTTNTGGTTTIGGAATALASLSVSGATALNASVTTTTTQVYTGAVTVGDNKTVVLSGSAVTLSDNLAVGNASSNLSVLSDALTFDNAKSVTGGGALTLAPLTTTKTIGVAGGAGDYAVSAALLAEFGTLKSVTIGQAAGSGEMKVAALTLPTSLTLQGGSAAITLGGTVTGGSNALTLTTTASTALNQTLSGLSDLTVTNSSTLSKDVSTTGSQSYGGTLTLGDNVTLSGASVSIAALTGSTNNLTLKTDALSISGAVTGTGLANIAGSTDSKTIGLAGADKDLDVSQGVLDKFATFAGLTIGSATQTGDITSNAIVLPTATTIQGNTAAVNIGGAITGNSKALAIQTGGQTTLGAGGSGLASIDVQGSTKLAGTFVSSAQQSYQGAVDLTGTVSITGAGVSFGSTVNGAQALTVTDSGQTNFASTVGATTALTSLTTVAGGGTKLGGNVTTTGAQTYGDDVTLNLASLALVSTGGGAIGFSGKVDGATAFTVNTSGVTTFTGAVGGSTALTSLTTDAAGSTKIANVTTTGSVTFNDPVVLIGTNVVVDTGADKSANVTFNDAVTVAADATHSLTVNNQGVTTFAKDVGVENTGRLTTFTTDADGTTRLGGSVFTIGNITFNDSVEVTAALRLNTDAQIVFNGKSVTLDFPVAFEADGGVFFDPGTKVTGGGTVNLAPTKAATNIGVALAVCDSKTTYCVSQTTIDNFAGLTGALGIGSDSGTGTITVGALTVSDTDGIVMTSKSGNVLFTDSVNGFFGVTNNPLTVNTGGVTTLGGTMTGLSALTIPGSVVANSVKVTTTAAQSYATAGASTFILAGGGTTTLTGSTITIGSGAANTVDGTASGFEGLALVNSGLATFSGNIGATKALSLLQVGAGGASIQSVTTTGNQLYTGPVTVNGATPTLTGNFLNFNGTVDGQASGAQALVLNHSGTASFDKAVGGTTALGSINGSGSGAFQINNVTTTGDQTYNGAVTLNGTAALSGNNIRFFGALDASGGQSLVVQNAGVLEFNADVGQTGALGSLTTGAGAVTAGNVLTNGSQVYGAALTLRDNATLQGTFMTFAGAVDGKSAGAQALQLINSGTATFQQAVGSTAALSTLMVGSGGIAAGDVTTAGNINVAGASRLGGAITTLAGSVTLTGPVTLAANTTITTGGQAVNFGSTVQAQSNGGAALAIGGGGAVGLAGEAGGSGLALSKFDSGTGNLTAVGITTTGNIDVGGAANIRGNYATSGGTVGFTKDVTLSGDAAIASSGGAVTFGGKVTATDSSADDLALAGTGTTQFAGDVLARSLTTGTGTTTVRNVTTTADQNYGGALVLGGSASVLNASAIKAGSLSAGNTALTIRTDVLDIVGTATGDGTNTAEIAPLLPTTSIGVGDGAVGTLQLSRGLISRFSSFSLLTLGRGDGTGTLTVGDTLLAAPVLLVNSGGAAINVNGPVDGGGQALQISSGSTTIAGTISNLDTLTISGTTTLNGANVTTAAAQTYSGPVAVSADSGLSGKNISFASTIGGPAGLTVTDSGTLIMNGAVGASQALSSLTVNGALAFAGGSVQTKGSQTYNGAVALNSALAASGTDVKFLGTVNNAQTLTIDATGTATLAAAVGGATPLTALTINGQAALDGGTIAAGVQTFNGAATLGADLTLTGASASFNGTLNGSKALNSNVSGATTFGAAVGGTNALSQLAVTNATVVNGGAITTTGNQNYSGAVALGADATLTAAAIGFAKAVDGPGALTVSTTGGTTFGGNAGETIALKSLTVAAGSVTLPAVVKTSGNQTFQGPVTLAADTTLTGVDVSFNGTLDGARALTVNASGTTAFGAVVGGTTPLTSITTDAPGQTTIAADVTTTGNQTFNDPVSLLGSSIITAKGDVITFNNGFNGGDADFVGSANKVVFNGKVTGGGSILLAPSDAKHSIGIAGAAGDFLVDQDTITGFSTFRTVIIGRNDGSGQVLSNNLLLSTGVTVLSGTGNVQFDGTVNSGSGGAKNLTITTGGTTTFTQAIGLVSAPNKITVTNGAILKGGAINAVDSINLNGKSTVGAAAVLTAPTVNLVGEVALGGNDLQVFANTIAATKGSTGAGTARLAPFAVGGSIGIAGAAGDLQISQALLDSMASATTLTLGRADGIGAIASNAVILPTDVVVQSASGTVNFAGAVDSAPGIAPRDLSVNTTGLTSFNGSIGANQVLDTLSLAGAAQFAGGTIASSGAQSFGGTLTTTGALAQRASSVTYGQNLVAGTNAVDIQAGAMVFNGLVSGSGALSLAPDTVGTTIGLAGAAGTLAFSQATLDKFAGFATLTLGRADGTGAIAADALRLPTQTTIRSASGNVTFNAALDGAAAGAQDLTVTTAGTTSFNGAVGSLATLRNLAVTGNAVANGGSIRTSQAQTIGGNLTLGAPLAQFGSAVGIGGNLANGTNAWSVQADSIALGGSASGSGAMQLAPFAADGSIGIAGAAGTLQVSQGLLDSLASASTITIGRADGTGAIASNKVTLPTDLTLLGSSSTVEMTGTIDSAASGAKDLSVQTSGAVGLRGAIGATRALDTLTTTSATTLQGGTVTTTGAQTYGGAATLATDTALKGSSVSFGSVVDGAQALTINAGTTSFANAVGGTTALTSLTTDAGGTLAVGGAIRTTGAVAIGDAVTLNADSTIAGTSVVLGSTVNGAQNLKLDTAAATLAGAIGGTTKLASLAVSGTSALNAGTVSTTGTQSYAGAVTLGAATTLAASGVSFGATVDGAQALNVDSAGTTAFGGTVGGTVLGTNSLTSLTLTGGGAATLAGAAITTSGAQSYSGAMTVGGGNATFTASALTFKGNVSGAKDLTLLTDALTAGGIAGSGVLTIAPQDKSISIGLAGAAGAMQISQATIDSAAGFTAHRFGRADGTGAIAANDLTLRANTTLQTDSGNLSLNGKVDGAFDLSLNSGGITRIAGPVGSVTALKSLTTDNNKTAADFDGKAGERTVFDTADSSGRARSITTGAQTFNDPLVASVPMQFVGGAIAAVQPTSSFAGNIKATADSLSLKSGQAIVLNDVTLANGGAIETAGTLDLAGNLVLNGGTLLLTSTATPTALAAFTDAELKSRSTLAFGTLPVKEASATVFQSGTGTVTTAAGSTLALRSPAGGTISLTAAGNQIVGGISAVSGKLNDTSIDRFNLGPEILLGEVRIVSSQINVAGAPPANSDQTVMPAGLEADFMRLSTDKLTTGPSGQIRVRLPYNSAQGTKTSVPGITFEMGTEALKNFGSFGGSNPDQWVQVSMGGVAGGFLTVLPKGEGAQPGAQILLGGPPFPVPFYDGTGKPAEIRVFFNGATTQTAQETGALQAVSAVVEDSRQTRFEEAVRTENVTGRLRSGVIAEVGSGRPATVGRETIRLPQVCNSRPGQLKCE